MSFYKSMANKIISYLKKGNTKKLFQVVAKPFEDIELTLDRMKEWRDIDNSRGYHLDKLGEEIVQEYRNGDSDEVYRRRIKTKIIVNISKEDIESINTILNIYMGNNFIGLEEGWRYLGEPASLVVNVNGGVDKFPFNLSDRIKAGGVSFYVAYNQMPDFLITIDGTYNFSAFYKETGEFTGESNMLPYEENNLIAEDGTYTFPIEYEVSKAEVEILDNKQAIQDDTYSFLVEYPETNVLKTMHSDISHLEGKFYEKASVYHFIVNYPVCGEMVAGGE